MEQQQRGRTSEIEMIAARVVQRQSTVCSIKMEHITEKLDELASDVGTVKGDVTKLRTEVAVLKTRLTIVAAVSSSLPVIVVLLWELFTH